MKLSKKELMQKISDLIEDDEVKITVLEDMEDSIADESTAEAVLGEESKREFEELKIKYEDLKNRYKERFLKGSVESEKKDEDIEDKEIVDIKEI